jgi:hypothetical protein
MRVKESQKRLGCGPEGLLPPTGGRAVNPSIVKTAGWLRVHKTNARANKAVRGPNDSS